MSLKNDGKPNAGEIQSIREISRRVKELADLLRPMIDIRIGNRCAQAVGSIPTPHYYPVYIRQSLQY